MCFFNFSNLNIKSFFLFFFFLIGISIFAYDPVTGAEEKLTLESISTAGGQVSTTGGSFGDTISGSLAVNPALGGAEQRPIFDISYMLLAGLKQEKGFGHNINAAFLYPARFGTLAGSLRFLNSEFNSLKLGTMGGARFSYSKDITEKLLVGAGAYADFGKDWGLGLDLGVLYKFGDLGFFKDSKLGVSLTGIGKTFNPKTLGLNGKLASGTPAMFTPHIGFATTIVRIDGFKLGMQADISLPTFQNFILRTGLNMEMADMLSVRTGFVLNAVELKYRSQTFIPSFNVGIKIKINSAKDKNSFMAKRGWSESEIRPEFSAKPFHNGIWAFGAGVNMLLGLKDIEPPKIDIGAKEATKIYFSPNDDGEKDAMEIPIKITDKRYVTSWTCEIKDKDGKHVRTIANKIPLREMKDASTFFKLLKSSKKGVDVPEKIRWDGRTDTGEVAPDGLYTFIIKAEDDNHNLSETKSYTVVIDKTPPNVELKSPNDTTDLIFSPDDDGNKDIFTFENTGSKEDLWTATISNADGKIIRTFNIEDADLSPIKWDGKDNNGNIVEDGKYKYSIESIDRAGNKTSKTLSNIIVDTNKPAINISINKKAFSPRIENSNIELMPSVIITSSLKEWSVEVKNESGNTVKTFGEKFTNSSSKTDRAITKLLFDGKDKNGNILPEGKYRAFITAEYVNGYSPKAQTPQFILDGRVPKAEVSVAEKIFSPDGDGRSDSIIFAQKQIDKNKKLTETVWIAKIYKVTTGNKILGLNDKKESPIYTYKLGQILPPEFEWFGQKLDGTLAEDGKYAYIVRGEDVAGNIGNSEPVIVELNTEKANIILQSNYTSFSPNGDGSKDTIELYPVVKSLTGVERYKIVIKDETGKTVKSFTGSVPPKKITWDGRSENQGATHFCKDGKYSVEFDVVLANKSYAKSIIPELIIDTVHPQIQIATPYLQFSPVAGNKKQTIPIMQNSSNEKVWHARFIDSQNRTIKSFKWEGTVQNIEWNAEDDLGNKVADGKYTYIVEVEDDAGNKVIQRLDGIVVDSREAKGYISAKHSVFSPKIQNQEFSLLTNIDAEIYDWNVKVSNVDTAELVAEWNAKKSGALQKRFEWNGKKLDGTDFAEDGTYMAITHIEYKKGDIVTAFTEPFVLSTKPAKLNVKLSPKYFSPDNDGVDDDLHIKLFAETIAGVAEWKFEITEPEENGGKLFWRTGGKEKITSEIIWDGRSLNGETVQSATDYPFTFTVTDNIGITSVYRGYIPVDILVIRDGNKLKIAVPSIIFRANAADFNGLNNAIVDKNNKILKRVAEILNKFPDYQVQVEGHANSVTGTQKEEKADLIPLSTMRADAVRKVLIKNGVRSTRLSSIGVGSSKPIVSRSDRSNWWKNRRVEFVLIK